jgi:hypothetical protein
MEEFIEYGLYEQPNSGGMNGRQFTYIFSGIGRGKAKEAFNALWEAAETIPLFRDSPVLRSQCSISFNGYIETLTIVTGPLTGSGGGDEPDGGYAEFSLETNRIEKAIETHPNYKVCWSKDLYYAVPSNGKEPAIPAAPSWYTASKTPQAGDSRFVAAKDHPADVVIGGIPHRYVLAAVRTKPGVEVYPVDAPIVTEYKHFSSLSSAKKNLKISNKLSAPDETFGYPSSDSCWLVHPDGIIEENGDFVTQNVYQYADEWDSDIYEFA